MPDEKKRVLVPLAAGCEEMEAVIIIDVLRRGGIEVISAALKPGQIVASRGVILVADRLLDDVLDDDFDMIVLPGGGPGSDHLQADSRVTELLKRHADNGASIAAICAAPKVLASAGLLSGRQATSYPGVLDALGADDIRVSRDHIVTDGNITTSQGPGTAMDFALDLVAKLAGDNVRSDVERGLRPN